VVKLKSLPRPALHTTVRFSVAWIAADRRVM
jgi:hypothetical protein